MAIVKGRKNLLLILLVRLKKANISVDMLWRQRCRYRFFHCFVANFLHNIVVLDTNAFQVFPTISFTFRPLLSQNIIQNPQITLRKTETKHLKRLTFFSHKFSQKPSIQDESAICFLVWRLSKAKKNFTLILLWRKEISVLICFFFVQASKKMNS